MLDDTADVVQRFIRQTGIAVAGEQVLAVLGNGLVHVHAGTVVANDGLGHEGGGFAVGMGHVVHAVLEYLYFIGLLHHGVEAHANLTLAGGGHLVVVHLDVQAHLLHGGTHGGADIVQRVNRRHGEVAALHARAVARIAFFELVVRGPGGLLGGNLAGGAAHIDLPLDVVEDEELGLGAKKGGVADTGGLEVGLGALGNRAGVAIVALHGHGLHHVAAQDDSGVVGKGVQHRGAVVGHQHHVGVVDAFPAGDGRAVEHLAAFKKLFFYFLGRDGDVLLLAAGIGEAQVNPARFVLFYQVQSLL